MSTLRFLAIAGLTASMIGPPLGAEASTTYSVVRDYSIKGNPSGPWSYIDQNGLLTVHTRAFGGQKGLWDWSNSNPFCNTSAVERNQTGATASYATIIQPTDHLRIDPQNNTFNSARFQAPGAGSYSIKGDFLGIDTGEGSHPVSIKLNGTAQFGATIASYGQLAAFKLTLTLAAGDIVDFMVESGGACVNLSTGLKATIVGP
jgi:hypothetical protein